MLIFRLKSGVICSPEATLKLSDVASGMCDAKYEEVMRLPVHPPSKEAYVIDALDITKAISNAYPSLRVEMRGMLMTRVCPVKATVFQLHVPQYMPTGAIGGPRVTNSSSPETAGNRFGASGSKPVMPGNTDSQSLSAAAHVSNNPSSEQIASEGRYTQTEKDSQTSEYSQLEEKMWPAASATPYQAAFSNNPERTSTAKPITVKEGFLKRLVNRIKNGGLSMLKENPYHQLPQYTLDHQPRPGDREERLKSGASWDTRNKLEVGDNATKDP